MSDAIGGAGAAGPGGATRPADALAALRSGRIQGSEERLRVATSLLEGSFYEELFKAMRDTVPAGEGGSGRAMFEGLLDRSVAEAAAGRSERGIGAALYRAFGGGDGR